MFDKLTIEDLTREADDYNDAKELAEAEVSPLMDIILDALSV